MELVWIELRNKQNKKEQLGRYAAINTERMPHPKLFLGSSSGKANANAREVWEIPQGAGHFKLFH